MEIKCSVDELKELLGLNVKDTTLKEHINNLKKYIKAPIRGNYNTMVNKK